MGSQPDKKRLHEELVYLHEVHCVAGIKTGTEVEDMGFEEISYLREIAGDFPLTVKIGGPEARNDMRHCFKTGVDIILAPMVETVYALNNFVSTMKELQSQYTDTPRLAVNIESKTAVHNIDAMLDSRAFDSIFQVTIGRSDLSGSMHMHIDDPEVTRLASRVVRKVRKYKRATSLGGGLNLSNIENIVQSIPLDRVNSRHIVFENNQKFKKNPAQHLLKGLEFEQRLYLALAEAFPEKKSHYNKRASVLNSRMGLYSINKVSGL